MTKQVDVLILGGVIGQVLQQLTMYSIEYCIQVAFTSMHISHKILIFHISRNL